MKIIEAEIYSFGYFNGPDTYHSICLEAMEHILNQFHIPIDAKLYISLHDTPDKNRLSLYVRKRRNLNNDGNYPEIVYRRSRDGRKIREYYEDYRLDKILEPFYGKNIYLQISYEEK